MLLSFYTLQTNKHTKGKIQGKHVVSKRGTQGMGSSKVGRVRDLYKEKLRKKEEGAKLKI